ncbi:MAG: hypothetical protein U0350_48695 [Caldilineaceae bacterium]
MATITVSFDHLYGAGLQPAEILTQVQALEAAGFKVHLQVRQPAGMAALQQLPLVKQQRMSMHPFRLAGLLMLGFVLGITCLAFSLARFGL